MQNRHIWFLNLILAGFAMLMGARIGSDWKRANGRYSRLTPQPAAVAAVPVIPGSDRPLTPLGEVVSKNLFMPDRSNDRPRATIVPTAGPLPLVIGTMRLGAEYEALMSEGGQPETSRFRRVKTGEQVGPYTVVEIRDEAVVVEFQGQRTVVNVYQSAKTVIRAAASPPPSAARVPAAPVVETATAPPPSAAPAAALTPANASPAPNPMPDIKVTIEGNRRRFERETMLGPQVWYEDIK